MKNVVKYSEIITPEYRLFIIISFIIFLNIGLFVFFAPNERNIQNEREVFIPENVSFAKITDILYENKIINNKTTFIICGKLLNVEKLVNKGVYKIPFGLSNYDVIKFMIENSSNNQIKLTFPEGQKLKKYAQLISEKLNIKKELFLDLCSNQETLKKYDVVNKDLEGYLMPDTYYFNISVKPEIIISTMADEFKKFYDEKIKIYEKQIGLTKNQIVTLASIIECETTLDEERTTISGVYHNRLIIGMKLDADPTVKYFIPEGEKLARKYYKIDNAYNTYIYKGLPPSPISHPGRSSLIAAVTPEKHKYLYFVANPKTKGHTFSQSFQQHLSAQKVYYKSKSKK